MRDEPWRSPRITDRVGIVGYAGLRARIRHPHDPACPGLVALSRLAAHAARSTAPGRPGKEEIVEGFAPETSFGYELSERYSGYLRGDEEQAVAFLAWLAGGQDALEFAAGTGRIALPLTRACR